MTSRSVQGRVRFPWLELVLVNGPSSIIQASAASQHADTLKWVELMVRVFPSLLV